MSRRDWWMGVSALAFVVLLHAALPRYQWQRHQGVLWLRIDRWSGSAELVRVTAQTGTVFPLR